MAWRGVPFTTEESFAGFDWCAPDFWQQFIDQTNARRAAFGTASSEWDFLATFTVAEPAPIGIGPGAVINLQTFRRFPMLGADLGYGFGTVPAVGSDFPSCFMVSGGQITQAFLDRVNAFLVANGCPEMGSTPVASGAGFLGIPWTRKRGPHAAPIVAHGEPVEGDIIGRWIFNEWWAVLSCMDVLVFTANLGVNSFNGAEQSGSGSAATKIDALAEATTNFNADTPDAPSTTPPTGTYEGVLQITRTDPGPVYVVYAARFRGSLRFEGLNVPHATPGAKVAHIVGALGQFDAFGDPVEDGKVAYLDTHPTWDATPGRIDCLPHVPQTPAPTTSWNEGGPSGDSGYGLTPIAFVALSIPPPT